MNLATLEITPDEAKATLVEYEKQLATERTIEDEAIMMGYRAAARGLPVISLRRCFETAGVFESNGMPKLAIVRSDARECFCHYSFDPQRLVFTDSRLGENRGALVGAHSVTVPLDEAQWDARPKSTWRRASTIVPTIPPRFRPSKRRMAKRHILWEVESWTREVPKDPALLRHIRGDLWAVLAVWDLTELERLVLSQRG